MGNQIVRENFKEELIKFGDFFSHDLSKSDTNGYWHNFKHLNHETFVKLVSLYREAVVSGKVQDYKNDPRFPSAARMFQFYRYESGLAPVREKVVKESRHDPFPYDPNEWDTLTDEQRSTGLAWGIHSFRKPDATQAQKEALQEMFRVAKASSDNCKTLVKEKLEALKVKEQMKNVPSFDPKEVQKANAELSQHLENLDPEEVKKQAEKLVEGVKP